MENSAPSDTSGKPTDQFEDDPFPLERLKEFDSKAIIDELKCGICKQLVADAEECEACQQIICKECVNCLFEAGMSKKKKNPPCQFCKSDPWNLKQLHKMYQKMLGRLYFSCNEPNCVSGYTIQSYTTHEHVYPKDNEFLYCYHIKSDKGLIRHLDTYLSQIIEQRKQSNSEKDQHFEAIFQQKKFSFDLVKMKATQIIGNQEYILFRQTLDNPKQQDTYQWNWYENDAKIWKAYSQADSNKIEEKFLEYFSNPNEVSSFFILNMHEIDYQINFMNFQQTRVSSSFSRSIQRKAVATKQE